MRYITLKAEEIKQLEKLYANSPDKTVRKRSHCLLLSHQRRRIPDLMGIFNVSRRTIERWFDGWKKKGIDALHIQAGRGVKARLRNYEEAVTKQVSLHGRNLKSVLAYFKEQHDIIICKQTLQNFLKKNRLQMEKGQVIFKKQTQPR